jgi:ribosomal-protein-alanine N-acetyltransferase
MGSNPKVTDWSSKQQPSMEIRRMRLEDVDHILEVEKQSFTTPWSREAFQNELTQNHFAHYVVVEMDGEIIGYCGMWMIVDEAHITNIALLPEYRGRGMGETLLRGMMQAAKTYGAKKMTLEVRVSNVAAQKLYEKLGFEQQGVRPNYYTDNMEDAYIMWVDL